jgi:hypothetical protein
MLTKEYRSGKSWGLLSVLKTSWGKGASIWNKCGKTLLIINIWIYYINYTYNYINYYINGFY